MFDMKKIALFAAGTLFGYAGFKLLSSSDAKKVYTQTTAAVLRMKDSTMETVSKVQEQAGSMLRRRNCYLIIRCHYPATPIRKVLLI